MAILGLLGLYNTLLVFIQVTDLQWPLYYRTWLNHIAEGLSSGPGIEVYDADSKVNRTLHFEIAVLVEDTKGLRHPISCKQTPHVQ